MSFFHQLSHPTLVNLATALELGRLTIPFYPINMTIYVPPVISQDVTRELERLCAMGMTEKHIAYMLRLLAEERASSQNISDRINLVWTGHEVLGAECRDTSVVVRELFKAAQDSVLIASYAIDRGEKARNLFQVLASHLDMNPNLNVRMFLNVQRPFKDNTSETALLKEFAYVFRNDIWPGKQLPKVFYYPSSLSLQKNLRTCLHAKCIVVDQERLLITSANFTEAAHERNLEAGVVITDPIAARSMCSQFETLISTNILRRVPGL